MSQGRVAASASVVGNVGWCNAWEEAGGRGGQGVGAGAGVGAVGPAAVRQSDVLLEPGLSSRRIVPLVPTVLKLTVNCASGDVQSTSAEPELRSS